MAGLGNKIRGAAETVHGVGEGIRGTVLGTTDEAVHGAPTTKDANATQRGKAEFERGLQNVSGNNTTSTSHGYSAQTTEPGAPSTQGGHFPKHHREDAVLGTGQEPTNLARGPNQATY